MPFSPLVMAEYSLMPQGSRGTACPRPWRTLRRRRWRWSSCPPWWTRWGWRSSWGSGSDPGWGVSENWWSTRIKGYIFCNKFEWLWIEEEASWVDKFEKNIQSIFHSKLLFTQGLSLSVSDLPWSPGSGRRRRSRRRRRWGGRWRASRGTGGSPPATWSSI